MKKRKCYIIPTEKRCNAKCFFCITKQYKYNRKEFLDEKELQFMITLNRLLDMGIKSFEITGGGEPFLNNGLQEIIDVVRRCIPDAFIKLYTNGSIHREIHGINELNISTVHWDNEIIQKVYQTTSPRNLIEDLKFFYHPDQYKIRLSVPIFKGGIDNTEKAEQLIEKTESLVDNYVFRPLLEKTPLYQDYYVDFNIEKTNVEVDRECSCYSDVLLWWTDNQLYNKWLSDAMIV